jgi:hypothetical protein
MQHYNYGGLKSALQCTSIKPRTINKELVDFAHEIENSGLRFSEKYPEYEADDLMLECIKIANDYTQN